LGAVSRFVRAAPVDGTVVRRVSRTGIRLIHRVAKEGVTLIIAERAIGCRRSPWVNCARGARALVAACALALGPQAASVRADDIQASAAAFSEPITIAADAATRWREGVYDVWHLRGNCYLNQGLTYARGGEAVLWIEPQPGPGAPAKVIAYFEGGPKGQVAVDFRRTGGQASEKGLLGQQRGSTWFQRLESTAALRWQVPAAEAAPAERPAIYERGLAQFNPDRRRQLLLAQYNEFAPPPAGGEALPPGMLKINFFGRNDNSPSIDSIPTPDGKGRVTVASGGVRVLVEGLSAEGLPAGFGPLGVLDLSTDRAVIWSSNAGGGPLASTQSKDEPLEIYMEGNIEFRQGDRIVYADRMFYDVRRQIGVILNAELLTPLPAIGKYQYPGLVRLKAAAIQQLDASHFSATNALVTTSRLEEPAYDLSAARINFTDLQQPVVDPLTGAPLVGPDGSIAVGRRQLAEAEGNVIHLRGFPVFYWPTFATDLQKPTFIVDRVRIGSDSVFGQQAMVDFDGYQLFGMRNQPLGTQWHLSTDYLSERGFGFGTDFGYDRPEIFGFTGPATGLLDFWAIKDDGHDNLGLGRRDITPEEDFRFRLFGQHRQRLDNGWEVTGESGLLSDRTFLEQYYEKEWDELKDPRTGLRARRIENNREWMLEANAQVNDFFTETQWLPRLDHYWLGESLLGDRLTWMEHTSVAYADYEVATRPTESTLDSQWVQLPWEADVDGERLITRHELDLPLQLGVVKVVPFALGELARWGEALDGDPLERAYVHTGVRASLPMWAAYPDVRDPLFNLNGLAHKVVFDAELSYADASANFDELPLYDPLDDISIIEMRRRLARGALPPTIVDAKFDPRRYALRNGMQGWVTAPSAEIADDLMALRVGARQRWQTKRGVAGNQHIVDWLTLDTNATLFPDPDRDNFGEAVGLIDYDLRWHLGDRFSILSDGFAVVFGDGLQTISGGVLLNRPTMGNAYVGLRSINGPVTSNVVLGSYSYRLSEKWITTASAAFDFQSTRNIGQTMSVTRIGESMLMTVGFNVDRSKNNVGVNFMLEPRFLPNLRVTRTTGIEVPPAGAMGLE
jgi:hypothetical protein